MLTLLLVGTFSLAFDVKPARATDVTVYIKSDGSVVPSDAPISSSDNITYTFTGNISYPTYFGIVVQRNNTVIDGKGYTVQGNQTDYTYGLQFWFISNVTVKNVNVKNFYSGFIFYYCSNIVVSGNNATANTTDGIFLKSSINNTIVSNNVSGNSNCGIIVDTSNTTLITGNNAMANGNKGILLIFASNNTVCWNHATGNGDDGISILYYRKNVVFGNYATTNNHTGISLYHTYDSIVDGNNVTANSIGIDVMTFSNGNNIISGNSATENVNGINLVGSSDNTVSGNNATANSDGIVLSNSNRTMIIGNNASANTQRGIHIGGSQGNESYNNTVSGNSVTANNYGINLYSYAPGYDHVRGNTISGNNVAANTLHGIALYNCLNNTISDNNATANSYGIYLSSSLNTTSYHNNFMNNTHQAYSFNSNNTWDNGYPSGGNYWSDYNGTDLYRGPHQNETASDGIGDTPYSIDGNNQDNYPLMQPWSAHSTRYSWPMFHNNLERTGQSRSPAPNTNQTLWNFTTGGNIRISSPAVVDGKVYIGSMDHNVYCLDALTGVLVWNYTTGSMVFSSPAVADGKVYVGSLGGDRNVYCLDALTGVRIWNYTTGGGVSSSPAVADGKVYVGSQDFNVYCLNALTGVLVWNYTTGNTVDTSPAVVNGKVYVGSEDCNVYCLDSLTGMRVWNYTTDGAVRGVSPAVVDGKVYVGSFDKNVYCLDALTGVCVWNYTTGDVVGSSPAVADGKVYVGSFDKNLYCLDALTGICVWNYTTAGSILYSAPAVADGKVYVGSYDSYVYCLNASTGAFKWNYHTGFSVDSSPAVADGVVYVGSEDRKVYAFGHTVRVPEDFQTVQEAINAATAGDTVWIAPGIYHESIIINKTITLIGKPGSEPIFKGGGSGIAITIVSSGSGSTIAGITITSWDQGIVINGASGCRVYDNIMSLISQNGIALEGSTASNNQIYFNIFQQNTVAITLTASSTSNIVFNNIITSNSIGLDVESSGNVVCANMMTENQVAISIKNSDNNKFFHNDFVSNDVQLVIAASTGNVWDDGYPSGGNYWSGHTGPDMFSGPNQDQAGSDGIVDTSYTIATGSVDRYPLAHGAHDVGITSVTTSKTVVGKGCTLHVELKILNYGMYDENFPVAAYANTSTAATQSIALTKGSYIIVTLTWNTSSLAYGNYTISAYAWPVPDEADTADNTYIYGLVSVTIIGDVDGNVNVNVLDAIDVSNSFGKSIGQTGFNPNADFDDNGVINILDAITLANNFGQHYP
jgi:parallel beta-helix repeat protein